MHLGSEAVRRRLDVLAVVGLLGWLAFDLTARTLFGSVPWPQSVVDYHILYDASRYVAETHRYSAEWPYLRTRRRRTRAVHAASGPCSRSRSPQPPGRALTAEPLRPRSTSYSHAHSDSPHGGIARRTAAGARRRRVLLPVGHAVGELQPDRPRDGAVRVCGAGRRARRRRRVLVRRERGAEDVSGPRTAVPRVARAVEGMQGGPWRSRWDFGSCSRSSRSAPGSPTCTPGGWAS